MSYLREELVTGEGVAVELPVATLVQRGVSRLIDLAATVVAGGLIGLVVLLLVPAEPSEAVVSSLVIVVTVVTLVAVPAAFETLTRGKSPGRYAMGLRVVRDDGGPVTARQATLRALVAVVEIWTTGGGPAFVSGLVTVRTKRVGDVVAGTYAISERHAITLGEPSRCPPGLEGWVRSADLAPIPVGLGLAIRQFLARSERFDPAARERTGRELLAAALPYVAPAPPPGWHPEYVLAAILADRRRRDADRMVREAAFRARVVGDADVPE